MRSGSKATTAVFDVRIAVLGTRLDPRQLPCKDVHVEVARAFRGKRLRVVSVRLVTVRP